MRQPLNVTVTALRAEHHADPLGLGTSSPRLSWIVEADDDFRQHAYEVALDDPDGDGRPDHRVRALGRVGARAVAVPSADVASRAGRCVSGSVTPAVAARRGASRSTWRSPCSSRRTGRRCRSPPTVWARTPNGRSASDAPSPCAPAFDGPASTPPRSACTTTWLNGSPVGDEVLAPGWTSYGHRLRYRTSDVTSALAAGPNVIGMTVAEGWYRGRLGFRGGRRAVYGDDIGPIAQLELSYDDGTVETIATGAQRAHDGEEWRASADWRLSRQPVRRRERRRAPRRAGLGDTGLRRRRLAAPCVSWRRLPPRSSPRAARPCVGSRRGVPCPYSARRAARRSSTSVRTSRAESGSACAAGAGRDHRAPRRGARGRRAGLVAAAHRGGDRPLRPGRWRGGELRAGVHDPRVPVRRDRRLARRARRQRDRGRRLPLGHGADRHFDCSDHALNRLHDNVLWSMRGNFVDLPTDCPQRDERLGWTGDIQVFAPTATFLYDCCRLLISWLADLAAEQREIGTVPAYVPWVQLIFPPQPGRGVGRRRGRAPVGALRALRRPRGAGARSTPACGRGSSRSPRSPVMATSGRRGSSSATGSTRPRRRAIPAPPSPTRPWWPPPTSPTPRGCSPAPPPCSATRPTAPAIDELASQVTAAFNDEFVTPTGRMASDAQTAYALALRFDLLPERAATGSRPRLGWPSWCAATATASAPASSARRSCATPWSTPASSTTPTTCCCRPPARRGCTR